MDIFLQQILNGLVLGSMYGLIALGYTMVYGIMGLINFAHGEVVMFGAMITISVIHLLLAWGLPWSGPVLVLMGLIIAMLACMLLGFTIERVAYRPLRNAQRLAPLITAVGLSIMLQQIAVFIWGRDYIPFPAIWPEHVITIAGASITVLQIGIIVLCFLLMSGLLLLIEHTRLGRAMRATSQNPAVASLMGVNVNHIISATFVIGSALGAVAGVMMVSNYDQANYYMGYLIGMKAFTAAVLGGIGHLGGAVAGGILLGIIESLGAGYISALTDGFLGSNYQDIFAFIVLIMVLVCRPSGLLGDKAADRA